MEIKLCAVSEFGEDDMRSFPLEEIEIVVFRRSSTEFDCLEDRCSHADVRLSEGTFEDGKVECPAHGACFNTSDGRQLCMPAVFPVRSFPCAVVDGIITITLDD